MYLAIGKRVREYKKYLAKTSGNNNDCNTEKLRPRPPMQDPGTPDDNRSIVSFFGVGGRNNTNNDTQNPMDNDS